MTDLGTSLGSIIGGGDALSAISGGIGSLEGLLGVGGAALAPYNISGIGTMPQTNDLLTSTDWSNFVGSRRVDSSAGPGPDTPMYAGSNHAPAAPSFEDFAKDFTMSPGAQFALKTAESGQNNNAASSGQFYSGSNMRANDTIAEGIANQDLLSQYQAVLSGQQQQYGQYVTDFQQNLAGQSQDFSQREQSFQNMFNQETLGEKAAASTALLAGSGASSLGSLFGQQANAQASKGSGVGGLIGGLLTK